MVLVLNREAAVLQASINTRIMQNATERARQEARLEVTETFRRQEYDKALSDLEFRVNYTQGIKGCTWFRIEPQAHGSALLIVDDYSRLPQEEREKRLDEVDRSLTAWGRGLYTYLRFEKRWSWFPPWRWYMRRLWVPMKPMARRVSWMLILINGVFFVLFLFIALIFWIEQGRGN